MTGRAGILALLAATTVTAAVLLSRRAEAAPVPPPEPGLANLSGVVTDSVTGQPIAGVLVSLGNVQTNTDTNGGYIFANIKPGSYTVQFSKSGYQGRSLAMNIVEGNNTLSVQLVATVVVTGNLSGIVTDSVTKQSIPGVVVSLDISPDYRLVTYTDATGVYGFINIPPGTYVVTFTKSGYQTVTK